MDPFTSFASSAAASSSTAFDLNEVDFEYVERLQRKDSKKLIKIIQALEHEGAYPDLLKAAKNKLQEIDPKSVPPSFSPPSQSDSAAAIADLLSWVSEEKQKDAELKAAATTKKGANGKNEVSLPVRGHAASAFEDEPSAKEKLTKSNLNLGQELDRSKMSTSEIAIAAIAEKEKGNECFRAKEYEDAVKYYTRSLHLVPNDTTTLNNRAVTFVKQQNWDGALNDVTLVLQTDPHNWKALWRRGQVWEGKLFLERAIDDYKLAQEAWRTTAEGQLKLEHADLNKSLKKAQQALFESQPTHPYVAHLKKKSTAAASTGVSTKKEESKESKEEEKPKDETKTFKRMQIAEVDDDDEDEDEDGDEEDEKVSAQPASTTAAPSVMKRMPIQEVDDEDEEEDEEEIVAPSKSTPAPSSTSTFPSESTPAPTQTAAPVKKAKVSQPKQTFQSKSGMMIELVTDDEEEEEDEDGGKAHSSSTGPSVAPSTLASSASVSASTSSSSSSTSSTSHQSLTLPAVPSSGLIFERDWRDLKTNSPSHLLPYLRQIAPSSLPVIFSAQRGGLNATLLGDILQVVANEYLPADTPRALDFLHELTKSDRFMLNIGLTDSKLKKSFKQNLETIAQSTTDVKIQAQIQAVTKRYT